MFKIIVHIELQEKILGTSSSDPEIHRRFIASKANDAMKIEDEVAAIGVDAVVERGMTVFPKRDGRPLIYDYQVKGFFKDACGMLRRADDSKSKSLKAYKKEIDGLVFPSPREIFFNLPEGGEIEIVERPLRASTAQGDRVALASSEALPAGTTLDFNVTLLRKDLVKYVIEWLSYGQLRGLGQWRNSGVGRFLCTVRDVDGNVLFDNLS